MRNELFRRISFFFFPLNNCLDESVFGCLLEKLCAREGKLVPNFVQECIAAIESKEENLKTDGIYRASGNLSQVQKIRLQVDQNSLACLYQEEDVHVLAGSLKLFFREMREPLIPSELFDLALTASSKFSFSISFFTQFFTLALNTIQIFNWNSVYYIYIKL